jgi:hypothetical protein
MASTEFPTAPPETRLLQVPNSAAPYGQQLPFRTPNLLVTAVPVEEFKIIKAVVQVGSTAGLFPIYYQDPVRFTELTHLDPLARLPELQLREAGHGLIMPIVCGSAAFSHRPIGKKMSDT